MGSDSHNEPSFIITSLITVSGQNNTHKVYLGMPNFKQNDSFINGTIFQCPFSTTQTIDCHHIEIEKNKIIFGTNFKYDATNKSLLGMNLHIANEVLIVCAPNWVGLNETPEGICFSLNKFSLEQKAIFKYPLNTLVKLNRPYESHNLFGFSTVYNKKNRELIFGLPGFKDFSGGLCQVNEDLITTKIKELPKSQTNVYAGYSVAIYSFNGNDAILFSTPKHNNFRGKVELIDMSTQYVIKTFFSKNDTFGEYFGASIFVVDIDNDGDAEILIGAPLYSISAKQREVGRVYLFKDIPKSLYGYKYSYEIILSQNKKSGSRFGTSIAAMDLNLDHFNDIIISAPFEETSDRSEIGAIYIYYGTKNGLNLIDVKRIGAENISRKNIFGLGFTLWANTDFDGNGYRDLAIGSLTKVFVLRTYPIININASMIFEPKRINFSAPSCGFNKHSCFKVMYCIYLDSHLFDFSENELTFKIFLSIPDRNLDLKEERIVNGKLNKTVKTKSKQYCSENESFNLELKEKEDIFDIITPIEIQLSVALQTEEPRQFCFNCPVANLLTIYQEIGFEHGCAHQYCVSQLVLTVDIKYGSMPIHDNGTLVEGQYNSLDIKAVINNYGESSINTQMLIFMEPIHLNMIPSSDSSRCILMGTKNGFKCDITKLMITNQKEEFILRLDLQLITIKYLFLDFEIKSSSQIDKRSQLRHSQNITISKEAEFMMKMELEHHYNFSSFVHKLFPVSIFIEKSGPSNVDGVYLEFEFPNIIKMEKPFQYRCNRIQRQSSEESLNYEIVNETLKIICDGYSTGCSRYQCKLNRFESGTKVKNFDITLSFMPNRLKSSTAYKTVLVDTIFQLYPNDTFFNLSQSFNVVKPSFFFNKQITEENESNAKDLIIFSSAGFGILIIVLTTIILIKYGFFKRKKLEELKRVRQRMSTINPNGMLPIPIPETNDNE